MSNKEGTVAMMQKSPITVTNAVELDFVSICEIYAYYVENTTISLEETVPSLVEMKHRWQLLIEKSLPYLVAKKDGVVVGYAYAAPYRSRSAYRFTLEESVYITKDCHGLGIGYALLSALLVQCKDKAYQQMIAVIAGANNDASIQFHHKLGFRECGRLRNVGYKFGQWIDTILMQKSL
jgi:L-amino acid N-acyltransferase YncA